MPWIIVKINTNYDQQEYARVCRLDNSIDIHLMTNATGMSQNKGAVLSM